MITKTAFEIWTELNRSMDKCSDQLYAEVLTQGTGRIVGLDCARGIYAELNEQIREGADRAETLLRFAKLVASERRPHANDDSTESRCEAQRNAGLDLVLDQIRALLR
jgi:hypothetical protein